VYSQLDITSSGLYTCGMTTTMAQLRDTGADENGNRYNRWAILAGTTLIAELCADPDTNEIMWVWVTETHRGEGHATRLYQTATAERDIYHAPASHRTPEGDRFATNVGGPVMPDCTTCCEDLNAPTCPGCGDIVDTEGDTCRYCEEG
jgi:hypothetical protein